MEFQKMLLDQLCWSCAVVWWSAPACICWGHHWSLQIRIQKLVEFVMSGWSLAELSTWSRQTLPPVPVLQAALKLMFDANIKISQSHLSCAELADIKNCVEKAFRNIWGQHTTHVCIIYHIFIIYFWMLSPPSLCCLLSQHNSDVQFLPAWTGSPPCSWETGHWSRCQEISSLHQRRWVGSWSRDGFSRPGMPHCLDPCCCSVVAAVAVVVVRESHCRVSDQLFLIQF